MIIMSFVEMMVGTAQNIINYLLLLLYIVNCSKFIWFFDLIWFGHYNTAAWDGITLALCPSDCVVVIWFFRFFFRFTIRKHRFFKRHSRNVWQIFFSISSMMLTISLTSKADFFKDWFFLFFLNFFPAFILVDVSWCWMSVVRFLFFS